MVTGAKSAGKNPYRQYGTRNASGTTGKEGQVYFGRQKYKKKKLALDDYPQKEKLYLENLG